MQEGFFKAGAGDRVHGTCEDEEPYGRGRGIAAAPFEPQRVLLFSCISIHTEVLAQSRKLLDLPSWPLQRQGWLWKSVEIVVCLEPGHRRSFCARSECFRSAMCVDLGLCNMWVYRSAISLTVSWHYSRQCRAQGLTLGSRWYTPETLALLVEWCASRRSPAVQVQLWIANCGASVVALCSHEGGIVSSSNVGSVHDRHDLANLVATAGLLSRMGTCAGNIRVP